MLHIPEDYTLFFQWIKERSEAIWAKPSEDDESYWLEGAKWIGMKDEEIDTVEQKYGIKFIPEHREFLRILHSINRNREDGRPFFYNWLKNEEEITDRFNWPYRTIFEDISGVNKVWMKSWGPRPDSDEEKSKILSDWLAKAPTLIPIYGHRFVVSDPNLPDHPVLSVWGSDIIVYGWNLRSYLLKELGTYLELYAPVYDAETLPEVTAIYEKDFEAARQKNIPYWKDMILYWSSGWSSFGLEYPRYDDGIVQPIVKSEVPEGEEDNQKRFMA